MKRRPIVLLLFIVFIAARFIFPAADPAPFKATDVSWHDEGWVHNARNAVLFGEWKIDEFNPVYITPVFSYLEFISFKLFGVNTLSARFVSMLLGSISILLLYLFARSAHDYKTAMITLIFSGANYLYLMYNRVAMLETTMIFFMILGLWLYHRGTMNNVYYFLSAVSLSLAYFTKASAVFLIFTFILYSFITIFIVSGSERRRAIQGAFVFTLGMLFVFFLWWIFWLFPYRGEYLKYNLYLHMARNLTHGFKSILIQLLSFPSANNFFIRMPVVSVLSLVSMFAVSFSLIFRKKTKECDVLLLLWVVMGISQILLSGAYGRRMLFLMPPMAVLAARAFDTSFTGIIREAKDRIAPIWKIAIFLVFFYLAFSVPMALIGLFPFEHNRIFISSLLSIPTIIIFMKKRSVFIKFTEMIGSGRAMLLAVTASLLINLGLFYAWASERSYEVVSASKEIAHILPEKTKVQGNIALALSLENKIIPYFIAEGYGNCLDMLQRDDIEYILTSSEPYLGSENNAMKELVSHYPKAKIVKRFDLRRAKGENLSVVLLEKGR